MSALFDTPLGLMLGASRPAELSPEAEAFVVRLATMAANVVGAASSASVVKALAAATPESFVGAFADLVTASGPSTPGAQATLRGRIALMDALAKHGGLWRAAEAQQQLGVSRATLQQWREAKRVIALSLVDGSFGYPVAQFAQPATDLEKPRPLAAVTEVLAAAGDALSPAELISVLSVSQPFLGGRTGFDLLHVDPDPVIAMIRHIATPDDADAPVLERLAV